MPQTDAFNPPTPGPVIPLGFTAIWSRLNGKPCVTLSASGILTGDTIPNSGADFGPDTPETVTTGAAEANTFVQNAGGGVLWLLPGATMGGVTPGSKVILYPTTGASTPTWASLLGAAFVTLSPTTGTVVNNGATYGPGTAGTTTNGWAEAAASGKTIYLLPGAFTIPSTVTLANQDVEGLGTATVAPSATGTYTVPTGFTDAALLNANGSVRIHGVTFLSTSGVTVNAVNQVAAFLTIDECPSEIRYEISAPSGAASDTPSCQARITRCRFTLGGGVWYTINGAAAATNLCNAWIEENSQDSTSTVALIEPDPVLGTNASDLALLGMWVSRNRVAGPNFTGNAIINLAGTTFAPATAGSILQGAGGGDGNCQIVGNQITLTVAPAAGAIWVASGPGNTADVVDNEIGAFAGGGANLVVLGSGAYGIAGGGGSTIRGNVLWAQGPGGFGTANGGNAIYVIGGTINLVNIETNTIIGGNMGVLWETDAASLTDGYAIIIRGNRMDKQSSSNIYFNNPAGSVIGEIQIVNNYLQNANWANSGSGYGVMLNGAGVLATYYGPIQITGNHITTHQGQNVLAVVIANASGQGSFGSPITIRDNSAVEQTTSGTLTPVGMLYDLTGTGLQFSVPGSTTALSVPASGTVTTNPLHVPMELVITGGVVTAVAVNGVTVPFTSGSIFIDCNDTYTITYTTAPTTFTAVMHG